MSSNIDTAPAYIYLAFCCLQRGELGAAHDHLDKARLIHEKRLIPNHFQTAYRLLGSGDLALAEGDKEAARRLYEKAVRIFGETAVTDHPDWQIFQAKLLTVEKEKGLVA